MDLQSLVRELVAQNVVTLPPEGLPALLAGADLLRQEDTHLSGFIRVVSLQGTILVQEELPDGHTILLRRFGGRREADQFVAERLETYERMWDGCGCKVNYYD